MRNQPPLEGDNAKPTSTLVGLALSYVVGCLLFVPLWAGLNFAFGTALDGPIGAFVMETPCQRLAGTTEPLSRYTLGTGKVRLSSSVCHFASGPVRVDGRTDGLGFTGREFAYLVLGFVGYAVCLAGALALTISIIRVGRRFFAFALGRAELGQGERSSPMRSKARSTERSGAHARRPGDPAAETWYVNQNKRDDDASGTR